MDVTIEADISEQDFMEGCLNMWHSGIDSTIHLVFYAFAKTWHIDKLIYYRSLFK